MSSIKGTLPWQGSAMASMRHLQISETLIIINYILSYFYLCGIKLFVNSYVRKDKFSYGLKVESSSQEQSKTSLGSSSLSSSISTS